MLRDSLVKVFYKQEKHFHWRGKEVTRIENLSDAVFGFSIALIVMSSDVPTSFHELMQSMRLAPAFGVCFLFLWMLWTRHYIFFSALRARRHDHAALERRADVRDIDLRLSPSIPVRISL